MNLPMKGVRVLDMSAVLSGPLAAGLLCDQGAEVIKVESYEGDTTRRIGPAKGDMSSMFIATNRGKRGIAVDLKHPDGVDVVRELARRADVLVENMRPGVLTRLGLGWKALSALNPRLVYLSISGFGQDGPRSAERVYDGVIQAAAGVCHAHRNPLTGEPSVLATTLCDKLTALTASQAICAALFARERTGKGEHVRVSMLDAALAFQWPDAMYNHVFLDEPPPPAPDFGLNQRPWKALDGWFIINVPKPEEFAKMCAAFGRPALASDERFSSVAARMRHSRELREELDPIAARHPVDEIVARLVQAGVPAGRINDHADVIGDRQVRHNGTLVEVDHGDIGRVRLARSAARFGDGQAPQPRPAARPGEHTTEVLRELGIGEARVKALLDCGAVRQG